MLAAAIEKGIDPDTTYYTSAPFTCTTGPVVRGRLRGRQAVDGDAPTTTPTPGTISVTSATLRSDNTVYAQLTLDVGPDNVWRMAKRLGVHLTQKPVASIGLGSLSVSPLDMAAAYATFAAGGIYAKPTAIRKVVLPNGKVDKTAGWGKPQTKRVALARASPGRSPRCSAQNALYGTGCGLGRRHPPERRQDRARPSDHADAWFDGYTRDFSTVVWMGYPRGEIPMLDVHGQAVAGATFPVPIWHLYMAAAEKRQPGAPVPDAERLPGLQAVHSTRLLGLPRRPARRPRTTTTTDDDGDEAGSRRPPSAAHADEPAPGRQRAASAEAASAVVYRGPAVDELLTIDEALALVLERVAAARGRGRGARRRRRAACSPSPRPRRVDLPSFPASAMDGFALRAADAPATLPVVARIAAGRPGAARARGRRGDGDLDGRRRARRRRLGRSDRGRRGARRRSSSCRARSPRARTSGRAAAISRAGDPVVAAGVRLGPAHLGALAAAGVTHGALQPASRASSLAVTGTRAALAGRAARAAARSTTRTASSSRRRSRSTGATVERLPPVQDDAEATRAAIERGLEADVLVTSGGVSVGVHDLVRATEAELGVEEVFWRVAVRPGKPVAFGVRGRTLVFGLPGQPGLVARRLRALRPPGAARAAGARRARGRRSGRAGSAAR